MESRRAATRPVFGVGTAPSEPVRPRFWALLAFALLPLVLGATIFDLQRASVPAARPNLTRHSALAGLPLSLKSAVLASLGARSSAYTVIGSGASLQAQNGAQRMHIGFDRSGAWVDSGSTRVGLRLRAVGYGTSLRRIKAVAPTAKANRVTYTYPGLSEWYRNGPLGLEQGFTIPRPIGKDTTGPLTLALSFAGNARVSVARGARSLLFTHPGSASLHYGGLRTTDADGHALRSWLATSGRRVLLHIDAQAAAYPLRVDPLVQNWPALVGVEESGAGQEGWSVAISGDGRTAIVGAPEDDDGVGAAWIFTGSGSTWTLQGNKLTESSFPDGEASQFDHFGTSVALSSNGDTALIGRDYGGASGAVTVLVRSGATWHQQATLEHFGSAAFGQSVALSSDGNTALIGARNYFTRQGQAWVFARAGEAWTLQASLVPNELDHPQFGLSVALAGDGNAALVGGEGGAWSFTRSGTSWSQEGSELQGDEQVGATRFGEAVALAASGDTALVGGSADDSDSGAAWVFTKSGSAWLQQGPKLAIGSATERFGASVALSGDGNTALIGSPGEGGPGGAWRFTRSGPAWTRQGVKIFQGYEPHELGRSVALSADAATAVIGAPGEQSKQGLAWVYTLATDTPAPPSVQWSAATELGHTSATLSTFINPNNATVSACWIEYGMTESYGETAPCPFLPGDGESLVQVQTTISSLAPGTTYHARVVATNALGATRGEDLRISTKAAASPVVAPAAASDLTEVSATLRGTVNPNGEDIINCHFEYGPTRSYGTTTPCSSAPPAEHPVPVTAQTSRLAPDSTYHFRVVAETTQGISASEDEVLLTPPIGTLVLQGTIPAEGNEAISSDGNTIIVGDPADSWHGSARIFARSGSHWTEQARFRAPSENQEFQPGLIQDTGTAAFGSAVALSADGNTALVGAPESSDKWGAAWLFTRSGLSWSATKQLQRCANGHFGESVSLSADAETSVVGAARNCGEGGNGLCSVCGYALIGNAVLGVMEPTGPYGYGLGSAVVVSPDGNTVLAPGVLGGGPQGVWVFTHADGGWSGREEPLLCDEGDCGTDVALSYDGDTAVTEDGYVFTRSSSTWAQQTRLRCVGAVAVSYDGNTAQVGGCSFVKSGGEWRKRGATVAEHRPVSMSSDGDTVLIGDSIYVTGPPIAVTAQSPFPNASNAELSGDVNPDGGTLTDCHFDYGTDTTYGLTAPCAQPIATGVAAVKVSASVLGLTPGATYHYRLVATGSGGTTYGADETLTTPPVLPELGRCLRLPGAPTGRFKSAHCTTTSVGENTGKYEWEPWPTSKMTFAAVGRRAKIETAGKATVSCTGNALNGEYTGSQTATMSIAFSGCEARGALGGKCQSEGAKAGEVVTSRLEGQLGVVKLGSKPAVGWDLRPASESNFMVFTCDATTVEVTGSVIAQVTSLDKMVASVKLKLKAVRGKQAPEQFEAGVKHTLTIVTQNTAEQAGLTMADSLLGEEAIEIKAVE